MHRTLYGVAERNDWALKRRRFAPQRGGRMPFRNKIYLVCFYRSQKLAWKFSFFPPRYVRKYDPDPHPQQMEKFAAARVGQKQRKTSINLLTGFLKVRYGSLGNSNFYTESTRKNYYPMFFWHE